MDFNRVVPQSVQDKLITNMRGWIFPPLPGSLGDTVSKLDNVLSLSVSDVGFPSPDYVREAAKKAIDDGHTHYTYLRDLRVAITEKLKRENNIEADPDTEIIISSGCHAIISQVFTAFVGSGDEVIMGSPDLYFHKMSAVHGGQSAMVSLKEKRDFHLDPEEVADLITPQTKILAITTPESIGAVHRQEDLEKLADLAIRHDLLVISDEIYEKLNYGKVPHFSIASLPAMKERTVTINGFSKGYAMTGWRVGYCVVPENLILAVKAANAYQTIRLNSIAQYAAIAALRGPQEPYEQMVAEYKRRMNILVDGINAIDGLRCKFPDATYYCWVNLSELGLSSDDFVKHCLFSERLMLSSGTNFAGPGGEYFIRTSSSSSEETIREGLRRLKLAVERLKQDGPVLNLSI